jgi:septal ring factor EnvC (AmiA/AmiB activator)
MGVTLAFSILVVTTISQLAKFQLSPKPEGDAPKSRLGRFGQLWGRVPTAERRMVPFLFALLLLNCGNEIKKAVDQHDAAARAHDLEVKATGRAEVLGSFLRETQEQLTRTEKKLDKAENELASTHRDLTDAREKLAAVQQKMDDQQKLIRIIESQNSYLADRSAIGRRALLKLRRHLMDLWSKVKRTLS